MFALNVTPVEEDDVIGKMTDGLAMLVENVPVTPIRAADKVNPFIFTVSG